jgi:hypothetical protein
MVRATLTSVTAIGIWFATALPAQEPPAAPARGPSKEQIQLAVQAGIKFLKENQGGSGMWSYNRNEPEKDVGCTALVGLALLVAGVPPEDRQVAFAANYVRGAAGTLTEVYPVSLAIMFLDRNGNAGDSGLIRSLGAKLTAGMVDGGWSYKCGGGQANAPNTPGIVGIGQQGPPAGGVIPDNSNTQFAILALWIARKHGLPAEKALLSAENRLRNSQRNDGGWGYGTAPFVADKSTPAMTCVGLLGLFLGFGVAQEREATLRASGKTPPPPPAVNPNAPPPPKSIEELGEDKQVKLALRYLANYVGNEAATIPEKHYFLWSLERVCVAYKFTHIGEVDWYSWGAELLLKDQSAQGNWGGKYGDAVHTSFALLFLARADLVGKIRTTDLKAGKDTETTIRKGPGPAAGSGGAAKPKTEDPPAVPGVDRDRLASTLVFARDSAKQEEMIAEYKAAKGPEYTFALALAIKDLPAGLRDKARKALAERMARLTVGSLEGYLEVGDRELRLAAAVGGGLKGKLEAVPMLIKALKDSDTAVAAAAYESLKSLTGQKFDASPDVWSAWWQNRKP